MFTCSISAPTDMLWAYDRGTSKMLKYDLQGHFLYSWGTWGDFPGGFWGVHGFSVDQDGNFYVPKWITAARRNSARVRRESRRPSQQAGLFGVEITLL